MEKLKLNTKNKVLIIIFIILVVGLSLIIYVFPQVANLFQDTYTLEYGTIENCKDVEYLVVRNEELVKATNDGLVNRIAPASDLVRIYSNVCNVGSNSYYSNKRGIVSYYYDNLENYYTIDSLEGLKSSEINEIKKRMKNEEDEVVELTECGSEVLKGDPIFKIVDNSVWYMIIWLNNKDVKDIYLDKNITIKFEDGSSTEMFVSKIVDEGNETEIVLASNSYYEGFDKLRIGNASVVLKSVSGLILETDSIVTLSDGTIGVYVLNGNNDTYFVPVNILLKEDDKTVVSRNYYYDQNDNYVYTVKMYDTVLRKRK